MVFYYIYTNPSLKGPNKNTCGLSLFINGEFVSGVWLPYPEYQSKTLQCTIGGYIGKMSQFYFFKEVINPTKSTYEHETHPKTGRRMDIREEDGLVTYIVEPLEVSLPRDLMRNYPRIE